jgi:ribosomal protein S18 acetylase RimI-like enzyme
MERGNRINLARLIAHPHMRGQGIGRRLVTMLMTIGADLLDMDEYSLFVYRDNTPALECYRSLGFEVHDSPSDESMADVCYYLTRPVVQPE